MATNHCNRGDVFSKYSECFDVCTVGVGKANKTIAHDNVAFKALDFYPDEYKINDDGELFISPANHFAANTYLRGNFGITVCFPMDECFSSHKFRLVEEKNIHFMNNNRQLWIKPIRQLASYGEFFVKDSHAVVCYPKLSDSPLKLLNGLFCILSIIALCWLLIHLKLKLNKSATLTGFPAILLFGFIFQTLNYLWMCPLPLIFVFEKYFFMCAFLWMTFQIFQVYQKVRSYNLPSCLRFHNKYLPFLVSLLPVLIERLYSCKEIHFFDNSCDFLHTYSQYLAVILDLVIAIVIVLNSILLRLVKSELFHKQPHDSTHSEQYYLYSYLTLIGGVYIVGKSITGTIAIEEVNNKWFYVDTFCQTFGSFVVIVYCSRL